MNAEFNWWLLIVGVAAGAGLAWLTLSDWGRREEDLELDERAAEAAWISDVLRDRGEAVDPVEAEEVLALHRAYLQQAGLLGSDADYATGPAPRGDDDAGWGPNQWAREAWDEEVVKAAQSPDRQVDRPAGDVGAEGPTLATRPSIRAAGSAAPRAAADRRQVGPEPPQA
jgi:hypothetical protein